MKTARWVFLVLGVVLVIVACGGGGAEGRAGGEAGGSETENGDDAGSSATWQAEAAGPEGPLAVEAVEVRRAPLVTNVTASGVIRGIREARVVSETQGIIRGTDFELGQAVAAGERLVSLDSDVERLQMEQARRQLETARVELRATEQLAERGNASQVELARVRAAASGAEAAYEQAKKRFEDKSIAAPISGRIAAKSSTVTPGNYLNPGVEVARIVDLARLEMEISVGEREVGYLEVGAPVSVTVPACPDAEAPGAEVASIAAGTDPGTGSFAAVIRWDNTCPDRVRSGMSANATIEPQGVERVLQVPSQAVVRNNDGAFVFVAADGVVRRARVEVGRRMGARTEITAGLSEGDIVVTTATSRLRDGDEITATVREANGAQL
ncbi:MAG: efflux RND transporter periplasmic adaptor subunit [Spirochaetes bacterium]|jgi:RND family efflux transporter MFP subunit|nr:efflux RND transporter periplasmic adaptor subunit [Spirochaetota bacterium]